MAEIERKRYFFWIIIFIMSAGQLSGQADTLFREDGSLMAIGHLKDGFKDGLWYHYRADGSLQSAGHFDDGLRNGEWTWYHENGLIKASEKWKNGFYRKGDYWDEFGQASDVSEVLTNPEYPGGMKAFTRMVAENINYPEEVVVDGVEGRVVIEFQINQRGELVNPVIKEKAHPELDREALRVVLLSDTWRPAEFHGMKTSVHYTFPISFALK